ncbi:MAG TPA: energy transducer TonB [Xanthobacteraceae bacterium]|nr:energy transducer TonB [Xanthobacteraceae bacterium]
MRRSAIAPGHEDTGAAVRWVAAAAIASAAHVAVAAGYVLLRHAAPEGAPQAPPVIVDLAPLPVAPASNFDIAPGPQMQESLTQPEPDVRPPEPPKEPVSADQTSSIATPKTIPPAESKTHKPPAPRTTAPPRAPTLTASVPAAPTPGSAKANALPPSWIQLLFSHLLRYRQYPSAAQAARQEGVVMLSFTMDRDGRVLARHIVRGSGFAALDAEALAMIERAQPLPPFPADVTASTRSFVVPIRFSLR